MATMESIQEKLFPSNRFRLVALSPDAKEERMTVQLIRGHYTSMAVGRVAANPPAAASDNNTSNPQENLSVC